MAMDEILKRLEAVFADVFDREVKLDVKTTASDVEGWDSMRQISLVGAIEDEFNVSFTMEEVVGFKNVGSMVSAILSKVNQAS